MKSIEEKVLDIVSSKLGKTDVSLTSHLIDDLGADSLDMVDLIMNFEDEFGIDIPDEDAEKIHVINDIVLYLKSHLV